VVVVVERQSAFPPTTTPVPLTNPADGALTILLREKDLILLDRRTLPANLTAVVGHSKTVAAAVRPISEPGKLFADHLPPTALANHQAVADTLVFDPMEAYPGQVSAQRHTRPPGDLTDRKTAAEKFSYLVHMRYLKRKQ